MVMFLFSGVSLMTFTVHRMANQSEERLLDFALALIQIFLFSPCALPLLLFVMLWEFVVLAVFRHEF